MCAGHALLTRQMGGKNPCPVTAPTAGFNALLAAAFKLNGTVAERFGAPFGEDSLELRSLLMLCS